MSLIRRVSGAVERRLERGRKYRALRARGRPEGPATPVFVVGCQRSGTNMLISALDRAPDSWVYDEGVRPAFIGFRLAAPPVIEALIRRSPAPVIGFKPVCESHWADRMLEAYPGARLIWIFRNHLDVADSAVRNWGDHQRDILRWIVDEKEWKLGWRGERLSPEMRELVRKLYRPEMSALEAGAVFWYLRNRFFLDLGLADDSRVKLVRYEELVEAPERVFPDVFEFAGLRFSPEFVQQVFSSSVGRKPQRPIDPAIAAACDELTRRLLACHAAEASTPRD